MNLIEVVLPEASGLPTHVPQREVVVLVLDLFDIQTDSWHRLFELLITHLEEQCGLASVVKPQKQHFLVLFGISSGVAPCQCLFTQVTAHVDFQIISTY